VHYKKEKNKFCQKLVFCEYFHFPSFSLRSLIIEISYLLLKTSNSLARSTTLYLWQFAINLHAFDLPCPHIGCLRVSTVLLLRFTWSPTKHSPHALQSHYPYMRIVSINKYLTVYLISISCRQSFVCVNFTSVSINIYNRQSPGIT